MQIVRKRTRVPPRGTPLAKAKRRVNKKCAGLTTLELFRRVVHPATVPHRFWNE